MTVRTRAGERGQVLVLTAIMLPVLLGMAGFTIDLGSWYQRDRATQSRVDAAATAGAQLLPDTGRAYAVAAEYAEKNPVTNCSGGSDEITVTSTTVAVTFHCHAEGYFTQVFGFHGVTVGSTATATHYRTTLCTYVNGDTDPRYPATKPNNCNPRLAGWSVVTTSHSRLTD